MFRDSHSCLSQRANIFSCLWSSEVIGSDSVNEVIGIDGVKWTHWMGKTTTAP